MFMEVWGRGSSVLLWLIKVYKMKERKMGNNVAYTIKSDRNGYIP